MAAAVACVLAAVACLVGAVVLAAQVWAPVSEGVRSMSWPSTEGVLLEASRWRQYQPGGEVDSGYDESWLYLDYAYTAPGTERPDAYYRSGVFDVTTSGDTRKHHHSFVSMGMAREAMRDAPSVRVFYDPNDMRRSVLQPGIAVGTTTILMVITTLLGCAIILWRACVAVSPTAGRMPETLRDEAPKKRLAPAAQLLVWILLLPTGWLILTGSLGVAWDRLLGGTPPTALILVYLGVSLIAVYWPRSISTKFVGGTLTGFMVAIPLVGMIALACLFFDGDGRIAYEPADAVLIDQLDSPNPFVRAASARRITDRGEPVDAGPRLLEMLHEEQDERVRKAVADAARRLGVRAATVD